MAIKTNFGRIAVGLIVAFTVAAGVPALAAKKAAKKASGVYCEQGGRNITYPASRFKPNVRSRLVVGKKATINIAGIGPIQCRVY
jgi:hypothetical protein